MVSSIQLACTSDGIMPLGRFNKQCTSYQQSQMAIFASLFRLYRHIFAYDRRTYRPRSTSIDVIIRCTGDIETEKCKFYKFHWLSHSCHSSSVLESFDKNEWRHMQIRTSDYCKRNLITFKTMKLFSPLQNKFRPRYCPTEWGAP